MCILAKIIPSKTWINSHFCQPCREGIERCKRAYHGKILYLFEPKQIPWKERVVYAIKGTALLLPIFAAILWLFLKLFYDPEYMSLD